MNITLEDGIKILEEMKRNNYQPFKIPYYCFIKSAEEASQLLLRELPKGYEWYELNGTRLFHTDDRDKFAVYLVIR